MRVKLGLTAPCLVGLKPRRNLAGAKVRLEWQIRFADCPFLSDDSRISMPAHPATFPEAQLLAECDLVRTRRGGPGGQHRNKVETAVVITHRPSGVSAEASERRSQAENRAVAVQRLRIRLALAIRHPVANDWEAEGPWSKYTRGQRIAINPQNPDFPGVLALALDQLAAGGYDPAAAAERLGISSSQLLKLVQTEPAAWSWLQDRRQQAGLKPLHAR